MHLYNVSINHICSKETFTNSDIALKNPLSLQNKIMINNSLKCTLKDKLYS
jgi:hypothetical protein